MISNQALNWPVQLDSVASIKHQVSEMKNCQKTKKHHHQCQRVRYHLSFVYARICCSRYGLEDPGREARGALRRRLQLIKSIAWTFGKIYHNSFIVWVVMAFLSTFLVLNCFEETTSNLYNAIISRLWNYKEQWIVWMTMRVYLCIIKSVATAGLASQRAGPSAVMILTQCSQNIPTSALKVQFFTYCEWK